MNKHVPVNYTKSNNFQLNFADGVYGGITPTGKLCIYFYESVIPEPTNSTLIFNGNQSVEQQEFKEKHIPRVIKTGITIDPDLIPELINWLQRKHDEYKNPDLTLEMDGD